MADVLDRIKKLLRLARDAANEHEAASAAERAAALMAEHEIHEATIRLDDAEPAPAEPIDQAHVATRTARKVAWHMRLISPIGRSYGCRAYWMGGSIRLFGRLSSVQAATYTSAYLMREVERLADAEGVGQSRAWRNAFRLGCASRISSRILAQVAERERTAAPSAAPSPSAGALVLVRRDRAEVETAYAGFSRGFRNGGSVGNYSSGGGYNAGHAAGERVHLGVGSRGGLKAGQGTLK
jgi:hypothetical protein